MAENQITVVGNLTRDVELKFMNSGAATARFSIAFTRKYKSQGEDHEATSYFDVDVFGPMAENVANTLHKGDRAIVTGRLEQRSWETDDGRRSVIEIKAEAVGPDLRFSTASLSKLSSGPRQSAYEEPF